MPYAIEVPPCPRCNSDMYDNRASKKNPKSPDFRCKNKDCVDDKGYVTGLWEKDIKKGPASKPSNAPQAFSSGPRIPAIDGPETFGDKLTNLFNLYDVCLDQAIQSAKKLDASSIGTDPQAVVAMAATLFIQAVKAA